MPETLSRLETVKRTSFRSSSLQSIANLFSTPQKSQGKSTTGIPVTSKSSTDDLVVCIRCSKLIVHNIYCQHLKNYYKFFVSGL